MGIKCVGVLLLLLLLQSTSIAQSGPPPFGNYLAKAATDTQRLNVYRNIFTYYREVDSDSGRYYLEQGVKIFSDHNYMSGKAALLGMLSGIYSDQGLPIAAKNAADEAFKLYKALKDEKGIAKIHNSLGVIEGRKGNYNLAIRHFLLALQYFERISDTANIINTFVKLGTANDFSGNSSRALAYYQSGLELSLQTKESANTAHLYNNIGSVYASRHEFDKALIQLNKALAICENPMYAQARVAPLMNIGNIYTEKDDPVNALKYYRPALQLARATGMREEVGKVLHSIGVLEGITLHQHTQTLAEALVIARELGNKTLEVNILTDMATVAHINGQYKDEVSLLKEEKILRDSIYNIEKAKEIANLQAEYELTKTNTQLAALKTSEYRNLQKKNLIIVIAVVLALTLFTLLFFFIRSLKLNKELSRREFDLKKANKIKDRLFSIIGHDLRGPVANIPALINIYRSEDTTDDTKNYILDSLEENSQASLETLEKLLNWGNLQIKGNVLNQTIFPVTGIIDHKLRLFRVAANNKNITIVNNVPDHIKVHADENHFKFVLRNLLSNAIKYTNIGGLVEIHAENAKTDNTIIFSVTDNGIGIDKEEQQHIFEQDNKSATGTANEPGTSIGLMLCREFILQNGGKIWVKSEKDKGSVFYFTVKNAGPVTTEKQSQVLVNSSQNALSS